MGNRISKILHLIVMAAAFVVLIVFLVIHCKSEPQGMEKALGGLYGVMIIWAGIRVFSLARDLKNM
jgi:uncharacterized protein YoxC